MTGDRGSASLELALMTPALIVLLLFVVFVGRMAQARGDVDRAARDAARAASLARTADAAIVDGNAIARSTLDTAAVACSKLDVEVDVDGFEPGGSVGATVSCTVALADVSLLRIPGERTVRATFSQPVDTFRGLGA